MTPAELATLLTERLDRIETKVDATKDHCAAIDVTTARQAVQIEHHIKRTDALEERIEQVASAVEPVVSRIKGAAWLLGGLTSLGGLAMLLKDLLGV